MVKLTVGIISGFGKVNAQIFGKSCNCQKTGEIVFWGPNPLNCCTFSKRQLERVLQTSNSNTDKILLVLWVTWLHGPTCVKISCKRQVASDGLLPFFSLWTQVSETVKRDQLGNSVLMPIARYDLHCSWRESCSNLSNGNSKRRTMWRKSV